MRHCVLVPFEQYDRYEGMELEVFLVIASTMILNCPAILFGDNESGGERETDSHL